MSKKKIVRFPDKILKKPSEDVANIDTPLYELVQDMVDTMKEASGVGLAAVQVAELLRMCVIDLSVINEVETEPLVVINPEIIRKEDPIVFNEACLSIPGFSENVQRFNRVSVKFTDIKERERVLDAEGLLAIAFQHEMDHMDGRLYIDRLSTLKKGMLKKKILKEYEKLNDDEEE